jgi:hypothetical protein
MRVRAWLLECLLAHSAMMFGVWCVGFGVWGLGFGVWDLAHTAYGPGRERLFCYALPATVSSSSFVGWCSQHVPNPQPLHLQPPTPNPQPQPSAPSTLNSQTSTLTLNPRPSTLDPQPPNLNPQPLAPSPRSPALDAGYCVFVVFEAFVDLRPFHHSSHACVHRTESLHVASLYVSLLSLQPPTALYVDLKCVCVCVCVCLCMRVCARV